MSISDKATITTHEIVSVQIEGFEPIPDLMKKSEWNGMWELVHPSGSKVILMHEAGPFGGLFDGLFGPKPRDVRIVAVSPALLVPIAAKEAA
jgi:hypothetical protein